MSSWFEAVYGRLFAGLYDFMLRRAERASLRRLRAELLQEVGGRTLEIGAGTGLNLEHYSPRVELVLTDPSPHMARALRRKLATRARAAEVLEASAESLPFADQSFDSVVSTLVLCTTPDPTAVLCEVSRVLVPGGRFFFLEHVRASDSRLARWQDRLAGVWRWAAAGCVCNRETLQLISRSPLTVAEVRDVELGQLGPLVRPAILGKASRI